MGRMDTKNYIRCLNCFSHSLNWLENMITLPKITMVTFLIVISVIAYYLFYPHQVVDMKLNNGKIPVINDQVMAGTDVQLYLDFEKKIDCKPEIEWYLVDGFVSLLSDGGIRRPLGKQSFVRLLHIPETAPKTKVHLRIEYKCKINPLKTIYYSWDTEDFQII